MSVETIERPSLPEVLPSDSDAMPPIFGRCPVCGKPLRPRDRYTDEVKAPPVGAGVDSRAKCDGCGAIIEYVGNGEWVVWDDIGAESERP